MKCFFLMRALVVSVFFLSAVVIFNADAIIMRHDVPDEKYQSYARNLNYTVAFYRIWEGKEVFAAMGTLIRDNWVLTAAHVAEVLVKGGKVVANGEVLKINDIIKHPKWNNRDHVFDIALVQLNSKAKNLKSVKLYKGLDEKNKIVTFIGRGYSGNGQVGVVEGDFVKRAANNRVIEVKEQWIEFIFNQGEMSLELEGISGPGDSGGPALIYANGEPYLAGVSSWQDTAPSYGQEGRYGVIENYSRVSFFSLWIEEMLAQYSSD